MNGTRNGFLILLLATALPACALQSSLPAEPPPGLTEAWFHNDCAPWDGPALSLYLGPEPSETIFSAPFPHLRVSLYSSLTRLQTGERLRFEVPGNQAHAVYCESEEDCRPAAEITLELSELEADLMAGSLEILFETGPPVAGSFRASRIPFQALCG
jgi:hypothetical protein